MYHVTEAVAALFDANQPQVLRITGTDANGNAINITEANVMSGGFSIDRYSCTGNRLEIGTAIAAELTLKVANFEGEFSDIKFEGAELFVEVGIADWTQENPTVSWVPCGYFTPDEQPRNRSIITMSALDRMMKLDAVSPALTPWTTESGEYMRDELGNILYFITQLSFPATVANLVQQISVVCDVPMTQNILNLPNASLVIQEMPKVQEDVTFRKLIQWCAGLMGTNAYINWNGELCFSWYSNTGYNTTPDRRFSSDIHENDIVLTGVTYTDDTQTTYLAGTDAYTLDMTGNQLMAGFDTTIKESVLQGVKNVINGFTYRAFEAKVMPAPWLFPMDRITFTDLQGNTHLSLLTNVNTTINGATVLKGAGETVQTASYAPPSGLTTAQINALHRVVQASNEQMEAAIENATEQITGANGSTIEFVYDSNKKLSEILVMDQPNRETATKIWRWNSGGLGFSKDGYGGPYSLAMTKDGSIMATMITTGELNASLLKAGIIQDLAGLNYWNLATGEFKLSANTQVGNSTIASQGDITTFGNSLTQQNIFNRLTNNGQSQGIVLNNGQLYINASYIAAGILASQNNTGTQFDLANGVITTVGEVDPDPEEPEPHPTYEYQTEMTGGLMKFYNGKGANAVLVGTISSNDGTNDFSITPVNTLFIDGRIFFSGDFVVGRNSNVTVTDTGGLSFDGYTGTITDMYGNEFEVIKGIIVQPT